MLVFFSKGIINQTLILLGLMLGEDQIFDLLITSFFHYSFQLPNHL